MCWVLGLFHEVWWWLVHPHYFQHLVKTYSHIWAVLLWYTCVCAKLCLFTSTSFINTGRDVLVSQIIRQPKHKNHQIGIGNDSFQDFGMPGFFLENRPSVGIENPQISRVSHSQVLEPETPVRIGEPCAPTSSKVAVETGAEKVQPAVKDLFVWVILSACGMDVVS